MANYTIRVQLMGDPTSEEYSQLHEAMSSLGFERTVQSSSRIVNLPHGLYYGSSSSTASEVCLEVAKEARRVQGKIKLFVAEAKTWSAIGCS